MSTHEETLTYGFLSFWHYKVIYILVPGGSGLKETYYSMRIIVNGIIYSPLYLVLSALLLLNPD